MAWHAPLWSDNCLPFRFQVCLLLSWASANEAVGNMKLFNNHSDPKSSPRFIKGIFWFPRFFLRTPPPPPRRGPRELIRKPRPLAVIRNRRLSTLSLNNALLDPLRSVQFKVKKLLNQTTPQDSVARQHPGRCWYSFTTILHGAVDVMPCPWPWPSHFGERRRVIHHARRRPHHLLLTTTIPYHAMSTAAT